MAVTKTHPIKSTLKAAMGVGESLYSSNMSRVYRMP